jgi:hypothetical protein
MRRISFLLFFFWSLTGSANSFVIGHNLSPTTEVPEKGTATVGTYLASYSFSDRCHVGTSPWMAYGYNSYSLLGRCQLTGATSFFDASSLQVAYIKSDDNLGKKYRQTLAMAWWTMKHEINSSYSLYTTVNYMYFWDETLPFSLRREPGNNQPYQFTVTTLHQIHWTDSMGMQFELGILGVNYNRPMVHNGYSFYKRWESVLLQVGISMTGSDNNFDRLYSDTGPRGTAGYDYSVHPELQLQYFF